MENEENKTKEGPKEGVKIEGKKRETTAQRMRQIIIETDGNSIHLIKAETHGKIELVGVLQSLIGYINSQK